MRPQLGGDPIRALHSVISSLYTQFSALAFQLDERLDAYDDPDRAELGRRPIGALVAEICRALDVQVDWSLWEEEEWACQEAQTKAPGSPYASQSAVTSQISVPPPRRGMSLHCTYATPALARSRLTFFSPWISWRNCW